MGSRDSRFMEAWARGDIGGGKEMSKEVEKFIEDPRPSRRVIDEEIRITKEFSEHGDPANYKQFWMRWKQYAEGTLKPTPNLKKDGWEADDFRAVFNEMSVPDEELS